MIKIAWHEQYMHPLPEGHRFPMLKYELIPEQLLHEGIIHRDQLFSPDLLDEGIITKTHQQEYWEKLRDQTLSRSEERRIGFPLSPQLVDRELRIAGGTIDASLFARTHGIAFNVAGGTHHAGSSWGEGFCLLNDQSIAANFLLNNSLSSRILIVDLDVHQGNGTAEIFSREARVFTFSMHGDKNFPFKKERSDLDIALEDGVGDETYLSKLNEVLPDLFDLHQPDFVFYLAGADVLATDKLGKLSLSLNGCKERDRIVLQSCRERQIPVQVSMGGGYSADIRQIVHAHCNTFRLARDLFV